MTEEQTATATATRPGPALPEQALPERTLPEQAASQRAPRADAAAPVLVPARDEFTFTAPPSHRAGSPAARPVRAPQALVRASTAVAVLVLSAFFVLIVSGRVVTEGPVVLTLTQTHGVHLGDLLALAAWGLAVAGLLASALALRSRR